MDSVARELQHLTELSARMLAIDEAAAGTKTAAGGWSKKEILGHLIDSAANNHQRFVRLQIESTLTLPGYRQPEWVRLQNYQGRPWRDLVEMWSVYNRHLAHVIAHLDPSALGHTWHGPDGDVDLAFIATDYLVHLRHHMAQILGESV